MSCIAYFWFMALGHLVASSGLWVLHPPVLKSRLELLFPHFLALANVIQHSSRTCRSSTPSFASWSALSFPGMFVCADQITRPSPWNLPAAQPLPDFVDGWLRYANSVRFGIDSLDYTDVVGVQRLMLPWGACSIAVLTASRAASPPRQ